MTTTISNTTKGFLPTSKMEETQLLDLAVSSFVKGDGSRTMFWLAAGIALHSWMQHRIAAFPKTKRAEHLKIFASRIAESTGSIPDASGIGQLCSCYGLVQVCHKGGATALVSGMKDGSIRSISWRSLKTMSPIVELEKKDSTALDYEIKASANSVKVDALWAQLLEMAIPDSQLTASMNEVFGRTAVKEEPATAAAPVEGTPATGEAPATAAAPVAATGEAPATVNPPLLAVTAEKGTNESADDAKPATAGMKALDCLTSAVDKLEAFSAFGKFLASEMESDQLLTAIVYGVEESAEANADKALNGLRALQSAVNASIKQVESAMVKANVA